DLSGAERRYLPGPGPLAAEPPPGGRGVGQVGADDLQCHRPAGRGLGGGGGGPGAPPAPRSQPAPAPPPLATRPQPPGRPPHASAHRDSIAFGSVTPQPRAHSCHIEGRTGWLDQVRPPSRVACRTSPLVFSPKAR